MEFANSITIKIVKEGIIKNIDFLKKKVKQIKINLLKLICDLKTGHIGGSLI